MIAGYSLQGTAASGRHDGGGTDTARGIEIDRVVEADRPFVDVIGIGISTILTEYPPLGSSVVVELSNAAIGGKPWRVRGVVREVQPGAEDGFRVGIEVRPTEIQDD